MIAGGFKTTCPHKMFGAFAYGDQELYDFLGGYFGVEFQPASIVNDPYRIGLNDKMFSVNTAVEEDLTGQVCSESVGYRELTGVGGVRETHVGAQRSRGGSGVIALHSTGRFKNSQTPYSKIFFELQPGAKVSISRNDVDTVVTEHGTASLKGKSVRERVHVMTLIVALSLESC